MMHSVDKEGRIIMANAKIHRVLGYEDGELVGMTIFDLYAKSCHHEALSGLKKIQEAGVHNSIYSTMMTKRGAKIRVDIVSSALLGLHKEFLGTISVSRIVDSELLLRALHGVLNSVDLSPQETESIRNQIAAETVNTAVANSKGKAET
jgi:PAS domain S-box-containing protein